MAPSGDNLAVLTTCSVDVYSTIAREFMRTVPLPNADRIAAVHFVDENSIMAGSTKGYITIASTFDVGGEPPEIMEFSTTGPRKLLHPP